MVVISIIVLITATALPTLTSLFTAGADQQAFNVLSAQLSAARALAITKGTYAGVHVQMSDNPDYHIGPNLPRCYAAIIWDDPSTTSGTTANSFDLAPGYQPRPMPGSMAFGRISDYFLSASGDAYDNLDSASESTRKEMLRLFTTFTIIFNPAGEVVTYCRDGNSITYPSNSVVFSNPGTTPSDTLLWENFAAGYSSSTDPRKIMLQKGVLAVTLFDYKVLEARQAAGSAEDYLNEYGQFLALNLYTGKFFARE